MITGRCLQLMPLSAFFTGSARGVRERFVLKRAMLWSDRPYRATRDLDLLRRGDGSFDAIREDIRTISSTPVEPDGVVFDPGAARIEAIRPELAVGAITCYFRDDRFVGDYPEHGVQG